MTGWTGAIEQYLAGEPVCWDSSSATLEAVEKALTVAVPHDAGPLAVVDFWRKRTTKLMSVVEALRRRDVAAVGTLLQHASKLPPDRVPAPVPAPSSSAPHDDCRAVATPDPSQACSLGSVPLTRTSAPVRPTP